MKTYTAFNQVKGRNIGYSFKAENLQDAVKFCACKFSGFPNTIIVENTEEDGKAYEGTLVWAYGCLV